jgi:hypothetical protein
MAKALEDFSRKVLLWGFGWVEWWALFFARERAVEGSGSGWLLMG